MTTFNFEGIQFEGIQEEAEMTLPITPCGIAHNRFAIQVAITFWKGKATGANTITSGAGSDSGLTRELGLRFEVSRITPIDKFNGDFEIAWRMALGSKVSDGAYRPARRTSFVLNRAPHAGLKDQVSWRNNYLALSKAVAQLRQRVVAEKTQFGLLLVVDTYDATTVIPKNPQFAAFNEAVISAIAHCDVVRLDRNFTPIETSAFHCTADADADADADVSVHAE